MSRRYAEPIEVGAPIQAGATGEGPCPPTQFRWRGRRYRVGAVLAHWVEDRAWWRHRGPDGLPAAAEAVEREVWRVEAATGGDVGTGAGTGVYDLVHDATGWRLSRLQD